MGVWRYTAIPVGGGGARKGELTGQTAADVRAALRAANLQVIAMRPVRSARLPFSSVIARQLRSRRREEKADVFDSLGTMLQSGLPLLESLDAVIDGSRGAARSMLVQLRDAVRSGRELAAAMQAQPAWFDDVEAALVRAGQHTGDLSRVFESMSRRHARSGEITQKLISALAYPMLVAVVGVAVVVFLSTRTLPDLIHILEGAGIRTPRLTAIVMAVGSAAAKYGLFAPPAALAAVALGSMITSGGNPAVERWRRRIRPRVIRRIAVAHAAAGVAELIRAGVPVVEALRIIGPTVGSRQLRRRLMESADAIERGDSFSEALSDRHWFDAELSRLVAAGERSGELERMLVRISERYERQSRVLIDRLAAFVEPVVILVLACLIGVVVMASVLPLLRLQEVL